MEKTKEKKGITLVALVITIIILLILSGITINLTIGQRGVLKRVQEAGRNYSNSANYEQKTLEEFDNLVGNVIEEYSGTNTPFGKLLSSNGIPNIYDKQDFANNKDGILEKVLQNNESIETIFNNPEEYVDILTSSQEAMKILGQNETIKHKVINNNVWCEKIANSEYRSEFSPYIIYNADSLIGLSGGRSYYKKNSSAALVASYRYGNKFILVSKMDGGAERILFV